MVTTFLRLFGAIWGKDRRAGRGLYFSLLQMFPVNLFPESFQYAKVRGPAQAENENFAFDSRRQRYLPPAR
jgi:hypothetical protein